MMSAYLAVQESDFVDVLHKKAASLELVRCITWQTHCTEWARRMAKSTQKVPETQKDTVAERSLSTRATKS